MKNLLIVQICRLKAVWFDFNKLQKMEDVDTFCINKVDTDVGIFLSSVAIFMLSCLSVTNLKCKN